MYGMNRIPNVISGLVYCLCLLLTGCSLYENAAQTLWCEPSLFSTTTDDCHTRERCCQLADKAWNSLVKEDPEIACSAAFERGFKDGFADYLYAGGTGEPPPVPPRCFWNLDYRTPKGHQAVEDWFAGFRRGTAAVRERGYREQMTIRSSLVWGAVAPPSTAPAEPIEQVRPMEAIPSPPPAPLPLQSRKVAPPGRAVQTSFEEESPPPAPLPLQSPTVAPAGEAMPTSIEESAPMPSSMPAAPSAASPGPVEPAQPIEALPAPRSPLPLTPDTSHVTPDTSHVTPDLPPPPIHLPPQSRKVAPPGGVIQTSLQEPASPRQLPLQSPKIDIL